MDFSRYDLVLYDIDGTLVDTAGAGLAALVRAAELIFDKPAPALDLAGSTDLGILRALLDHHGREWEQFERDHFFQVYHQFLKYNLSSGEYAARLLPGASASLDLCKSLGIATGLLTGNTQRGAFIKMAHFGLDHYFPFGAFGDDYADRNLLGPVALQRAAVHHQSNFTAARTLVIGDTPKDIACAQAMGAHCLAVATGQFSAATLRAHGADFVRESLSA